MPQLSARDSIIKLTKAQNGWRLLDALTTGGRTELAIAADILNEIQG